MLYYNMVKYYKRKVVRRGRRRRKIGMKRYHRKPATNRTGYLSIVQKDFFSWTIPAGPLPNGHIQQLTFNIATLQNFAELSRLFDQYRICAVSGTLTPHTNTNDTVNPGQSYIQQVDLDGQLVTTYDQILAASNAKQSPWNTSGGMVPMKKWYCKPRFLNNILQTINPPVYSQTLGKKGAWIDLADNGLTTHYGMNFGWRTASPVGLNADQVVNGTITYYLQFRQVK